MNISSPKKISLLLAAVISLLTALILVFDLYFVNQAHWLFIVLSLLLIFGITYYLLNTVIINFIFSKIKPIYRTVDHLHIADDELYDKIENNQYVSEIESKVQRWAKRKTKEISVLKANEKYRKEFLGNVSHELKTPIFNIQGYILTLIDGGLHDEEINMKYLIRAEKNINRLISIVKDLETISKLESGALKLHFENFNIINQIEEVIEMHEMLAKDHRIQLFFNQKPKGKLLVRADKKRIFEVISNLIINSILYGKNGGTTTIELTEKDDIVIVEVRDDGVGIDKKHLIRIFERFYRIDKSRSREIGGTGLGLSIVKHIIEAHRQKIKVTSKLEIGSTFAFSLKKSNHPQQLFEN